MRASEWVRDSVLLLGCIGCLCGPAFGWGDDGHRIIAAVAEQQLTPAVRAKVRAMLAGDATGLTDPTLAAQATWADKWRDSDRNTTRERYERTREWHYVNIPIATTAAAADIAAACHGRPPLPAGTPASAGPPRACLVDKIDQFIAELRDPNTPPDERRLALQFLLHLVGDLHQPLHAGDDGDRGGNDKKLALPGFNPDNLHQFWDTTVVRRLGPRPERVARELGRTVSAAQRREWSRGTPTDWARESFVVAKTHVYVGLPAPGDDGRRTLTSGYVAGSTQTAKQQLRKAGVRLAWVLNNALK
jgi:S1/P1 Nuclease